MHQRRVYPILGEVKPQSCGNVCKAVVLQYNCVLVIMDVAAYENTEKRLI